MTDMAQLREIAALWNGGATRNAIGERYGKTVHWVSHQLEKCRETGLRVRQNPPVGKITAYSDDDLAEIARRLRRGEINRDIATAMSKSDSWVSRGRDLALRHGLPVTQAALPARKPAKTEPKLAWRIIGDMAIALPYLRCLDPETSHGARHG